VADRYLLETSAVDGYLLEDGSGVLLKEGVTVTLVADTDAPALTEQQVQIALVDAESAALGEGPALIGLPGLDTSSLVESTALAITTPPTLVTATDDLTAGDMGEAITALLASLDAVVLDEQGATDHPVPVLGAALGFSLPMLQPKKRKPQHDLGVVLAILEDW
jgi:hypothetical protein